MCQPNTEHTLTTFTIISTAELAIILSCLINAERKIDDNSSKEVETFKNFPDFTSRKYSAKLTVGVQHVIDNEK